MMISRSSTHRQILFSDLGMLLTAIVWGGGIVAQRMAAGTLPPLLYTGLRFALGALCVLPWLPRSPGVLHDVLTKNRIGIGAVGLLLTLSISLQQLGIRTTEAGKSGFLTSLYLVLVPVFGLLVGIRTHLLTWLAVALAALGTFILCGGTTSTFSVSAGDVFILGCAVFTALHLLAVTRVTAKIPSSLLAFSQFTTCGIICLTLACLTEPVRWSDIRAGAAPILYGGVLSAGLGYTIQVIAQKHAPPAHAAVILGMESVFAALLGWGLLGETLGPRSLLGCGLILAAGLLVQMKRADRDS
jgi:drug/metabolite transporter (DMT)-like permease